MEKLIESQKLRETIRLLERKLGKLDDLQSSCCGITFAQCHAMVEIGRAGVLSLNDLADILGLDKSTMSRTINNLVNDGLVCRDLDTEDRRFIRIGLTPGGQKIYKEIEETMGLYFEKVYGALPANKREQVIESLNLLLNALSEPECCKKVESLP
ncbi:MAG TPA: MarR family transcriptional regulator [Bacillota bacterium]|nr:MarR family transcriptional regulator [Bacillota bacterium]